MKSLTRTQIVRDSKGTYHLRYSGSIRNGEVLVCKVNKPYNPFMVLQVQRLNGKSK
ncbi:hypothetical protein [Myxococcus phage Mx1]|nr:hypothetical protein [Myxococcus phage Mx1]